MVSPVVWLLSAVFPSLAAAVYASCASPTAMRLSMRDSLTNMSTRVPVSRLSSPRVVSCTPA